MSAFIGYFSHERSILLPGDLLLGLYEIEKTTLAAGRDNIRGKDGMDFSYAVANETGQWSLTERSLGPNDPTIPYFQSIPNTSGPAMVAEVTPHDEVFYKDAIGAPVSVYPGLVVATVGGLSQWAEKNPRDSSPKDGIYDEVTTCPGQAFNRYVNTLVNKFGVQETLNIIMRLPYSLFMSMFVIEQSRTRLHLCRSFELPDRDPSPYLSYIDTGHSVYFANRDYMIPTNIQGRIVDLSESSSVSF